MTNKLLRSALETLYYVEGECTVAISDFGTQKFPNPDDIPNGLRTVSHIKLSMIREAARKVIAEAKADVGGSKIQYTGYQ